MMENHFSMRQHRIVINGMIVVIEKLITYERVGGSAEKSEGPKQVPPASDRLHPAPYNAQHLPSVELMKAPEW
jgi:hypothetical protein